MEGGQHKSQPSARLSPCIGVCRLDPRTGLCEGCARSGQEIASWSSLDEEARSAIWDALPGRAANILSAHKERGPR